VGALSLHPEIRPLKLNICFGNVPVYAVKENIVQLPHIKPLAAFRAALEMSALAPGQLLVVGIRHDPVRLHRA